MFSHIPIFEQILVNQSVLFLLSFDLANWQGLLSLLPKKAALGVFKSKQVDKTPQPMFLDFNPLNYFIHPTIM
jgi:hypothetical protein